MIKYMYIFLLFWLVPSNVFAVQVPRSLPTDQRLKIVTYKPNQIVKFVGHYEFLSSIVFEEGEVIESVFMGNANLWEIVRAGNRMFLKPVDDKPTTNMTVITNKRLYQFELHGKEVDEAKGVQDEELAIVMQFVYPKSNVSDGIIERFSSNLGPDLSQPDKYNFQYSVSGSTIIAPVTVFDDNEFTYFQFQDRNAELPAFFLVNPDGSETIVNYRVSGSYIVVERVGGLFTLRNGDEVACVFNETRPMSVRKDKK